MRVYSNIINESERMWECDVYIREGFFCMCMSVCMRGDGKIKKVREREREREREEANIILPQFLL